jgi:hypothetical protein
MTTRRGPLSRAVVAAIGLGLVAVLAACGGGGGASPEEVEEGVVEVTLSEWSVLARPDGVDVGAITFRVTNEGPDQAHEFVVLRTQLNPVDLPVTLTGQVDYAAPGITKVAEVADIPVGETREVTVTLDAGPHVLICNDYTVSPQEAHYEMGMRVPFPVE